MRINKDLLIYVRLLLVGLIVIFGALTIIASVPEKKQPMKYIWVKPNSNDQDYKRDNYDCLKESQQRVSESSSEGRSASSSSTMQANNNLYNACMQARGWSMQREDAGEKKAAAKAAKSASKKKASKETEPDQVVAEDNNASVSPFVDNLKVGQDGDKAVATYDLVGKNGEKEAKVTVAIIIDGKRRTAETLHLTGDFGKRVKVGLGKKIIWKATADLPSNFDGELSWDVTAASVEKAKPATTKKVKKKAKKTESVSD